MTETLAFVIGLGISLIPLFLLLLMMVIEFGLDFMETTLPRIQKLKKKNYCKECGINIPWGKTYCDNCRLNGWDYE